MEIAGETVRGGSEGAEICPSEATTHERPMEVPGLTLSAHLADTERPTIAIFETVDREMVDEKGTEDRVAQLEQEITKMRDAHQKALEEQVQQTREMEERWRLTKEVLATKSAELSGARAFLSATDRLSEVEVLTIVRDLNESIYQVAVNLTDGWEKLRSSEATNRMGVDHATRPRAPSLVQRVASRDPTGLTFLLQSCLCSQVVKITSSWGYHQELAVLETIYKRLYASGERHVVATG